MFCIRYRSRYACLGLRIRLFNVFIKVLSCVLYVVRVITEEDPSTTTTSLGMHSLKKGKFPIYKIIDTKTLAAGGENVHITDNLLVEKEQYLSGQGGDIN